MRVLVVWRENRFFVVLSRLVRFSHIEILGNFSTPLHTTIFTMGDKYFTNEEGVVATYEIDYGDCRFDAIRIVRG